jgi:hypothetical protein
VDGHARVIARHAGVIAHHTRVTAHHALVIAHHARVAAHHGRVIARHARVTAHHGHVIAMFLQSSRCFGSSASCSEYRPRQVEVQVNIPVALCRASVTQDIVAGERYVLQFDLAGHGQCMLGCYRQRPGSVDALEPCPPAAAPR